MMMLSQMAGRFWGRVPFVWLAAVVGLGFALAGVVVLDDYGMGVDEPVQRGIATRNANYVMGDRGCPWENRQKKRPILWLGF